MSIVLFEGRKNARTIGVSEGAGGAQVIHNELHFDFFLI